MHSDTGVQKVFYSWQKDSPNQTNRSFIQKAIEQAITGILETDLEIDLVLDRDTTGVPGSPDIAQTILQKIDQALIVIADVSIINPKSRKRLTPNPNVLFELGYAVRGLSWDNVLPIFNLATGRIEDLPFDLRSHRPITYKLPTEENDKNAELKTLTRSLQIGIQLIVKGHKEKTPQVRLFLQADHTRLGVENLSPTAIEIQKMTLEYPQSIDANGVPIGKHPPITMLESGTYEDGTPTHKLTLVKTDAPIAPGYPDDWRLPPKIDSQEKIILRHPAFVFRQSSPEESIIKICLSLSHGNPIKIVATLRELLDPNGQFAF